MHIEPERDHVRVRVRIDGILHETAKHPTSMHSAIVSRIKVLARMDIAERRRPQDGRIKPDLHYWYDNIRTTTTGSGYTNTFGGTSITRGPPFRSIQLIT